MSHAAPYHHFSDRAALVAAVAEEGSRFLREAMLDRLDDVGRTARGSGRGADGRRTLTTAVIDVLWEGLARGG